MFYYMTNIVYPTQIAVFFTNAETPLKETLLLSLPSNLGLVFGEILLILFGTRIGHWSVDILSGLAPFSKLTRS